MNFSQSFRLAIKSLMTSKMRSLLTMLGIIIGVGAVIIITSLGNGMRNYMNDQFEQLGSNLVQAQVMGRGSSRSVDAGDMYELVEKYPQYLSGVTPYMTPSAVVRRGTDEFSRTSIYGVGETFYNTDRNNTMTGMSVEEGRFLTYIDVDRVQRVCVIGSYLADKALAGDALGKTITLSGYPFTVVGVLEQNADGAEGSGDDVIYIPYTMAERLGASSYMTLYMFTSTDRSTAAAAKGIVENRLYKTFQDSDYYFVFTSAEMMDAMDSMVSLLMAILTLIAAISLLVGGIGIMNIMLVSVTERTREIGIRKAIGAGKGTIMLQFLIEALMISLMGCAVGIFLSWVALQIISGVGGEDMNYSLRLGVVWISIAFSMGIGIIFGIYPANKAAKKQPIEALRYVG